MSFILGKWGGIATVVMVLLGVVWVEHLRADKADELYRQEVTARAQDAGKRAEERQEQDKKNKLLENKLLTTQALVEKMKKDKVWLEGSLKEALDALPDEPEGGTDYKVEELGAGQAASFAGVNVERGWLEAARAKAETEENCAKNLGECSKFMQLSADEVDEARRGKTKWKTGALVTGALFVGAVAVAAVK